MGRWLYSGYVVPAIAKRLTAGTSDDRHDGLAGRVKNRSLLAGPDL